MRVLFRDQTIMSRAAAMGRRLGATFRGPVLWLTVCGGLLVAAIFAGTIMMIGEFRERALANSERELENTVLLLTRHFDQQFDDSDTIAADVISRLRVSGVATPENFGERMSASDAHEILRSKAGVLSYLGDISIYDFERADDQLVAAVAGAEPQHLRAELLQDFQIRSEIARGPDRGDPQPHERQSEHHHCPPAKR